MAGIGKLLGDIPIPFEYPEELHLRVHELAHRLFEKRNTPKATENEFRMALNSVVYRFKSCVEAGEAFATSIEQHGDAPPQPHRYTQEREFFLFVMAGMSCLESLHYAVYSWGAAVDPRVFKLDTERQRRSVSVQSTTKALRELKHTESLVKTLCALQSAEEFERWQKWRNVLFHRGLPGRMISLSVGSEAPSQPSCYHDFGDLRGPDIDPELLRSHSIWLRSSLEAVLMETSKVMTVFAT